MYKATTARVINMGAQGRQQVWTAMARRSKFEQFLAMVLALLLAIPALVLILGMGALLLVLILCTVAVMTVIGWFKRHFGNRPVDPGRENVRVIDPAERSGR